MTLQAARQAALSLSADERWHLLEELWSSLADEEGDVLTDKQMDDLRARIAAYEADPSQVVPWEEARARLLSAGLDE